MSTRRALVTQFLDSRWFFGFSIGSLALPSLWIATLFRFPLVYDEMFHVRAIQFFSHRLSPFILEQVPGYSDLGSLAFGSVSVYHYLLSFPYRLLMAFNLDEHGIIIVLRYLNIAMVLAGLLVFQTFLRELGIRRRYISFSVLLFAALPMASTVAATVNYDNLLFLASNLCLLFATRLTRTRKLSFNDLVGFVASLLVAALTKFSFLPVFVVLMGVVVIKLIREHSWKGIVHFVRNYAYNKHSFLAIVSIAFLASLFVIRYGVSTVRYGTPIPSCRVVVSQEDCRQNIAYNYEISVEQTRQNRSTQLFDGYLSSWFDKVVRGYGITSGTSARGAGESAYSPVVFRVALAVSIPLSFAVILLVAHRISNKSWVVAIAFVLTTILSTLAFNAASYYHFRQDINVQPRYFLGVAPYIAIWATLAVCYLIKSSRVKATMLLLCFVIMSQGAGLVSHIMSSSQAWYWDRPVIRKLVKTAKVVVDRVVID